MKKYISPKIDVVKLDEFDVLTISGNGNLQAEDDGFNLIFFQ